MSKIYYKKGCWYFGDYFDYLTTNEILIPENIRAFVMDRKSYSLSDKETLHDSWMTSFKYSFNAKGKKEQLIIKFLGPYHDIEYQFVFQGIYSIKFKYEDKDLYEVDLNTHQFSLCKNDTYNYYFLFSNGQKISIKFKQLQINTLRKKL